MDTMEHAPDVLLALHEHEQHIRQVSQEEWEQSRVARAPVTAAAGSGTRRPRTQARPAAPGK